jgi:MFS family permease
VDVAPVTTGPAVQRSARRALIAAWIGWMFDGYENYAFVLVMPIAVRQLVGPDHLARLALYSGAVLAATLLGWATGGLVFGVLSDYVGRKRVLMLSILWYALFSGLTFFSSSYRSLVLCRFLTGLGLGAEWGAGTAIVAELWPASWRGRAAGALQAAFGVGFFLASAIWLFVGPLGPQSWRYMFLIGALPAFMLLYIQRGVEESPLWLSVRDRRRLARSRVAARQETSSDDRRLAQFTLSYLMGDAVLRRRLVVLLAMSISTVVGWWSVSTWIPQYAGQLAAAAGRDAQRWSSLAGLTYNIGAIAGYVAFGTMADLWGRKPAIQSFYVGALALSLCLFLLVHAPVAALVVAGANGFFTLGQFSWMTVYLPELFPTAVRGSAISLVFNASRYVAALGPLAAGWIIATKGSIAGPAAAIACIYVVGVLATPAAGPETRGQPLPA